MYIFVFSVKFLYIGDLISYWSTHVVKVSNEESTPRDLCTPTFANQSLNQVLLGID